MSSPALADCWYLSGPTASGKTRVGIELAQLLDAEIISLDSMAVYRGMDIGTAKPTAAEQQTVPHHLIDIVEPHQDYSLARYLTDAQRVVGEISARGRVPLFVGGTPLYLKALLRGIFSGPEADWPRRHELLAIAEAAGPETLHRRLAEVDPASAERLAATDTRRVIRALEVWEKTGESITKLQQQFAVSRRAEDCRVFVLDWSRPELVARINARVDAMFTAGLLGEVEELLARHGRLSHTAGQAVGYREVIEHLNGLRNIKETRELVQLRSRQFAKRQMTWFRSLSECRLLPQSAQTGDREAARAIAESQFESG